MSKTPVIAMAAGVVGGYLVALAINEGLLFLVWNGNGPDWYYAPIVITAILCTFGGMEIARRLSR